MVDQIAKMAKWPIAKHIVMDRGRFKWSPQDAHHSTHVVVRRLQAISAGAHHGTTLVHLRYDLKDS